MKFRTSKDGRILYTFSLEEMDDLNELSIPEGVELISDRVFTVIPKIGIKTLRLPKSWQGKYRAWKIDSIADWFIGSGLKEIVVDPKNPRFSSFEGVLYNKTLTKILWYPEGKEDGELVLPKSIKRIGVDAFHKTALRKVIVTGKICKVAEVGFDRNEFLRVEGNLTLKPENYFECPRLDTFPLVKITYLGAYEDDSKGNRDTIASACRIIRRLREEYCCEPFASIFSKIEEEAHFSATNYYDVIRYFRSPLYPYEKVVRYLELYNYMAKEIANSDKPLSEIVKGFSEVPAGVVMFQFARNYSGEWWNTKRAPYFVFKTDEFNWQTFEGDEPARVYYPDGRYCSAKFNRVIMVNVEDPISFIYKEIGLHREGFYDFTVWSNQMTNETDEDNLKKLIKDIPTVAYTKGMPIGYGDILITVKYAATNKPVYRVNIPYPD